MRAKLRPNGKFLTLRQAELEYGVPYARLREWIITGRIARLDDGPRSYLIRRADLDAFIESQMSQVQSSCR